MNDPVRNEQKGGKITVKLSVSVSAPFRIGFEAGCGIISIFHVCMVWIEKSVTKVTDRHHEACRVMPNSDPE